MTRITVLLLCLTLTACTTVAGVGEDVSGGARKVRGWFGN